MSKAKLKRTYNVQMIDSHGKPLPLYWEGIDDATLCNLMTTITPTRGAVITIEVIDPATKALEAMVKPEPVVVTSVVNRETAPPPPPPSPPQMRESIAPEWDEISARELAQRIHNSMR